MTLAASIFGGLTVSSIVEPAIAATIVAMALFDRCAKWREAAGAARVPKGLRLALIFAFAQIHGLGLAGALGNSGLDTNDRLFGVARRGPGRISLVRPACRGSCLKS